MVIINKKVSPQGFLHYLESVKVANHRIKKIILHHTSSSVGIWQGSASMLHYWNLYTSRGWKAGPHIFIAPDGIWLFSPIDEAGSPVGDLKDRNISIEIVGNYKTEEDRDLKMPEPMKFSAAFVVYVLLDKYKLKIDSVYRHLDFDPYCFCSPVLDRGWIMREILKRESVISNEISNLIKAYENSNRTQEKS